MGVDVQQVKIKLLTNYDNSWGLPTYATSGSSAMDLKACMPPDDRENLFKLLPGERTIVHTGISLEIPVGYEVQIRSRSGLALLHSVAVLNSPGTVDSDYRGQIGVILINLGKDTFYITHGVRIAQMVLAPVARMKLLMVDGLSDTERGEGGFGSTGAK